MVKTGISLDSVKNNNKSQILKILQKNGAMSRKDIANQIGLTPAAVTMLCNDMMEAHMILEKGEMKEQKRAADSHSSLHQKIINSHPNHTDMQPRNCQNMHNTSHLVAKLYFLIQTAFIPENNCLKNPGFFSTNSIQNFTEIFP